MKRTSVIILLIIFLIINPSCTSVQNLFNKSKNTVSISQELKNNDPINLLLYYPDKTMNKLIAEERYARFDKSLERTIVSELLKGSKNGSTFSFPRGTKLISVLRNEDTVQINLSSEFVKNFLGNQSIERMTIYSIVNSLTEIPGVKKVEFKIQGKTRDTLGGSVNINKPLSRDRSLFVREKGIGPKEVLERQLTLERQGKWLEAYLLYSDEESNIDRKYYHDYFKEMEEVSGLGFTNQDFVIGEYSLDNTEKKARIKVNFYTPTSYGIREKSSDIYFNCIKVEGIWMVDWLTAQ